MSSAIRLINRRRFLELVSVATAALAGCPGREPAGLDASPDAPVGTDATAPVDGNPAGLPNLGGAPDTHAGQTVAAFCDTVVPGAWRDPTGAPGAIDVGAPALFFDPSLPTTQLVALLTLLLDTAVRPTHGGRTFAALTVDEREPALAAALVSVPQLEFGVQLAKLAYLSTHQAGAHLGYPGANTGYVNDADFSFRRAMSTEMTTNGNYP